MYFFKLLFHKFINNPRVLRIVFYFKNDYFKLSFITFKAFQKKMHCCKIHAKVLNMRSRDVMNNSYVT